MRQMHRNYGLKYALPGAARLGFALPEQLVSSFRLFFTGEAAGGTWVIEPESASGQRQRRRAGKNHLTSAYVSSVTIVGAS